MASEILHRLKSISADTPKNGPIRQALVLNFGQFYIIWQWQISTDNSIWQVTNVTSASLPLHVFLLIAGIPKNCPICQTRILEWVCWVLFQSQAILYNSRWQGTYVNVWDLDSASLHVFLLIAASTKEWLNLSSSHIWQITIYPLSTPWSQDYWVLEIPGIIRACFSTFLISCPNTPYPGFEI